MKVDGGEGDSVLGRDGTGRDGGVTKSKRPLMWVTLRLDEAKSALVKDVSLEKVSVCARACVRACACVSSVHVCVFGGWVGEVEGRQV